MASQPGRCLLWTILIMLAATPMVRGDGKLFRPRDYQGSLEERSQEAIIVFQESDQESGSFEDLILKIDVKGQTDKFAWVIPFPKEPKVEKEDAKLFQELHNYVETQMYNSRAGKGNEKGKDKDKGSKGAPEERPVEVLSRRVVGSYDVAVVRENQAGALNRWLEAEGYQPLGSDAEDVIGFYRQKGYVFACVKVKDAMPTKDGSSALHPLRFTFQTGGYDGMYFPMKMSGLQADPFNVNLYVFYAVWINDKLTKHGYLHRGFSLRYRDWDSRQCEPNAGKSYSAPQEDPFLSSTAHLIPTVTKLFQKLHPGERYYLTNIQASDLKPADVRQWSDDLWLFPYNTRRGWVPRDARQGGIASAAWPNDIYVEPEDGFLDSPRNWWLIGTSIVIVAGLLVALWLWQRHRAARLVIRPGT